MTEGLSAGTRPAGGSRDRMDRFAPKAHERRRARSSYTYFVRVTKFLLPLVALSLIISVVLWPRLNPAPPIEDAPAVQQQVSTMISPRFFSTDADGRPYSIIAAEAEEQRGGADVIDLVRPEGEVTMADGQWLALISDFGTYDQPGGTLQLDGRVNMFRDDGIQFITEQAFVDIEAGIAWGDLPVIVSGPFGVVRGQGFRYADEGGQIVFTGRSSLVLNQAEPDGT